ncbi:MAG: 6-bladed beta-propeller [Prevotellaceae bacterium]|jgi:hypothetical protein|nr:6-bladed beta-propeller [Prevotellaceae bacterium]
MISKLKAGIIAGTLICALGACSPSTEHTSNSVIPIGKALDAPTEFGLSALGDELTYIPLETSDSVLIGNNPIALVGKDYIVVSSANQPIFVFDKNGKFLNQIGRIGEGPDEYQGNAPMQVDDEKKIIYVYRGADKLLRFQTDGSFLGSITLQAEHMNVPYGDFIVNNDTVLMHQHLRSSPTTPYLGYFDGRSGQLIDTIPSLLYVSFPTDVAGIQSMRVMTNPSTILIDYGGGKQLVLTLQNHSIWAYNGHRYLKEEYIDTIFTIQGTQLIPRYTLDLGAYTYPLEERNNGDYNTRAYMDPMYENEATIFFRLHTNHFPKPSAERVHYSGYYDKSSGEAQVMKGDTISDDINRFLPLRIQGVSTEGEFFGWLQAFDVVERRKEMPHPALAKIDEEDNPVLVIVGRNKK